MNKPPHTETPAVQDEREALTVLVAGATVYATNGGDVNRWWATVYPGFDDDGRKISQDECERIAAALAARAPQAAAEGQAVVMKPMTFDDGRKGWYVRTADFYCDIEPNEHGQWSVFFRDKEGREGYEQQTTPQAAPAPQPTVQAEAAQGVSGSVEGDVRELRQMLADCEPYLKDGETPAQRIERERSDTHTALSLLAAEKRKVEALLSAPPVGEPEGWLRDQRDAYEGPATLDPLFMLGRTPPKGLHGATYTPLYVIHSAPEGEKR